MDISNQANKKYNKDFNVFLKRQKKKIIKETALFCFVRIRKDLETLKVPRLKTVKDLLCVYQQLKSLWYHFFKFSQQYWETLECFHVATKLDSLKALSNALISWRNWDFPQIQNKAKIVFKELGTTMHYYMQWQIQAFQ